MSPSLSNIAEWRSLSAERDPELKAEGLLSLAGRLEARGEESQAAEIYAGLANPEGAAIDDVRHKAQARLQGLMGSGPMGVRAEVFLRRFVSHSTDPSALFAMGAAGAVFRAVRLAGLARLSAAPASFLSRGVGARTVSALGGLGAESLAFPLAARLGNAALGREQTWSFGALGREWGAGLLTLGALRASGAAMNVAARSWAAQGPISTSLLTQSSMLGAIWLAQHVEGRIGWRSEQAIGDSLAEALGTLLHFNVAARLSRAAFGPRFERWERNLYLHAESLISRPALSPIQPWFSPLAVHATALAPGAEGFPVTRPAPLASEGVHLPTTFPPSLYRDYRYPSGRGEVQPPRIAYSKEWRDWWKQAEPRLRSVNPDVPVETILANALPLREANRLWRMQIEDFVRLVGAELTVHAPSRLLEAMGPGYLKRDPSLLRAAEALAGPGAEVYEIHFPYSSVRFGEPNHNRAYADIHSLLSDIANGFGQNIFLAHKGQGRVQVRLPSLDLWDALNVAHFGENAHRMVAVRGIQTRDRMMAFRQKNLAPVGLTRQPTLIQDILGKAHSFFFTFHDAFHASIASHLPRTMAQSAGRLYWLVKASLPPSPLKEELLNRFSDLDPGSEFKRQSHINEFWNFTLDHFWYSFKADTTRDDFISKGLSTYPRFLERYQSLLRHTTPANPEEAAYFRHISNRLEESSREMNSLLVEVLRR